MYKLTVKDSFDSAHFLKDYDGKCGNIHGHRWKIVVSVQSKELREDKQQRGMCIDFKIIRDELKNIVSKYDHTFLIEKGSLKKSTLSALRNEGFPYMELDFRPTAENFSKHFFDILTDKGYDVSSVQVYETPNNCATYTKD